MEVYIYYWNGKEWLFDSSVNLNGTVERVKMLTDKLTNIQILGYQFKVTYK